jgi:hypothetical protein
MWYPVIPPMTRICVHQKVPALRDNVIDRLRIRLASRPPGEFLFPEIYGRGWERLVDGRKLRLRREFLDAVREGRVPGVRETDRRADGCRVYRWTGGG